MNPNQDITNLRFILVAFATNIASSYAYDGDLGLALTFAIAAVIILGGQRPPS